MWPAQVSPEVRSGCGWLLAGLVVLVALAAAIVGLR